LILLLVFTFYLLNKIRKGDDRYFKIIYMFFTVALIVISYRTLLVVNAEYIHFFQYAILFIPIFALTLKFGETLFWITLLGTIDEAYQYFILYPDWKYFDFNDVILNLLGGGIGAMLIYTLLNSNHLFLSQNHSSLRKWTKSPVVVTSISLLLFTLILYISGHLQLYPGANSSTVLILLSRTPPPTDFWIRLDWGKTYHILYPVEGVVLTGLLIGFYSLIDYRIRSRCK
ncbi:MAG: VanZ family protein, partial [Thermodesulfobacteriota bacterium]